MNDGREIEMKMIWWHGQAWTTWSCIILNNPGYISPTPSMCKWSGFAIIASNTGIGQDLLNHRQLQQSRSIWPATLDLPVHLHHPSSVSSTANTVDYPRLGPALSKSLRSFHYSTICKGDSIEMSTRRPRRLLAAWDALLFCWLVMIDLIAK